MAQNQGKKQQELQVQYQAFKNNLQQIAQKIGDVEQDAEEHKYVPVPGSINAAEPLREHLFSFVVKPLMASDIGHSRPSSYTAPLLLQTAMWCLCADPILSALRLVLETLTPLPQDRKCFRMVNGVLVERTVKDVVPALQTNSENLKKLLEDLVKQYKTLQLEMEKWKVGGPLPLPA